MAGIERITVPVCGPARSISWEIDGGRAVVALHILNGHILRGRDVHSGFDGIIDGVLDLPDKLFRIRQLDGVKGRTFAGYFFLP